MHPRIQLPNSGTTRNPCDQAVGPLLDYLADHLRSFTIDDFHDPPLLLEAGDTVECTVSEIGTIRNTIV